MKKLFKNKKTVIILCVSLAIVIASVAAGLTISRNNKIRKKLEQESIAESESISASEAESVSAEEASKKAEEESKKAEEESKKAEEESKKAEEESKKAEEESGKAEQATATRAPETTTRKQETTTKKQETTTKAPSTTKSQSQQDLEDVYELFGGKAAYEKRLDEVKNYKCKYCGKHNCSSITYIKDDVGNYSNYAITGTCPEFKVGEETCPICGKKLIPRSALSELGSSKYPDSEWCCGIHA